MMDTTLARTFLEIVSTGSFQKAAERLHISQTAVSARVRTLESHLGQPLFVRNKSGATLTRAGERFLRYAPTLVQMWQRACHEVSGPEGHRAVIAVGGEFSLWNPLLVDWLVWMRRNQPDVAFRKP
jgi:LysR family transcriptional regulator, flagellar master operon regulator